MRRPTLRSVCRAGGRRARHRLLPLTEVVATHTSGDLAGMTTNRVSIQTLHETDFVTSVSGNSENPTYIQTT